MEVGLSDKWGKGKFMNEQEDVVKWVGKRAGVVRKGKGATNKYESLIVLYLHNTSCIKKLKETIIKKSNLESE